VLLAVAVVFLVWTFFQTKLFDNYLKIPVLFMFPLIAIASLIMTKIFMLSKAWLKAWFASAGTILFVTFFGVAGLFPNLLPSSLNPAYNVTIFNSSASQLTLKIMLGVVLVMVPIVIAYQIWIYMFLKDKVNEKSLDYEEAY
jgi:cytochrome d ubiquinol oxidase subunit II